MMIRWLLENALGLVVSFLSLWTLVLIVLSLYACHLVRTLSRQVEAMRLARKWNELAARQNARWN